jgi:hypothetical protein
MYSFSTRRTVPVPERIAVCVNSRSRRLRTCDRITRASQAQPKTASKSPRVTRFIASRTNMASMTMIRNKGMTRKTSLTNMRTLPVAPPLYPATMPTSTATTREREAAITATMRELRTAKDPCQKMSYPLELVPRRWTREGFRSLGTCPHRVGS